MDTTQTQTQTNEHATKNNVALSYKDWLLSQHHAMKLLGFKNAASFQNAAAQMNLRPVISMTKRVYYSRADVERIISECFGSAKRERVISECFGSERKGGEDDVQ